MLFNPNWRKPEVKSDPHNLVPMIAWLETKDPDRRYEFSNPSDCLVAQYLKFRGERHYSLDTREILNRGWYQIVGYTPQTFGAALERAKAQLRGESKNA